MSRGRPVDRSSDAADRQNAGQRRSPVPSRGVTSPGRQGNRRPIICYGCKQPGHMRRNCPQRPHNSYNGPPNPTIKNAEQNESNVSVSPQTTRGRVTFAENPSVSAAHVIPSVQSGSQGEGSGAWHVLVGIAGLEVNATVDTAADIPIVSQNVYDSMQPKPHIVEESNIKLAGEGTGMRAQFLGNLCWSLAG